MDKELKAFQHVNLSPADLHKGSGFAVQSLIHPYRLQCYRWWIDEDDEELTVQQLSEQRSVIAKTNALIYRWLDDRRDKGIAIPPEQEALALLTLYVSLNLTIRPKDFGDRVERRAQHLLTLLPDSKLRTHLMVHLATDTQNTQLLQEARTAISQWRDTELTPEDHSLQQFLLLTAPPTDIKSN